jgi:hypothetical protein
MFSFRSRLPVTDEERVWVDEGFRRLTRMLGAHRLIDAPIILPTDEFFPDRYDKDEPGLRVMFRRVCAHMQVDSGRVDLDIIPDSSELMAMLPEYRLASKDPAGLHFGESRGERALIGIKQSLLQDPLCLIATLAHELAHVILLDDGHMSREVPDMEPMTDLATVFLGFGIFTANAARRFVQHQDDRRQGWSMSHAGYLPEQVYGYALARFARERKETNPDWSGHLNTNVKTWFRQSAVWLEKNS